MKEIALPAYKLLFAHFCVILLISALTRNLAVAMPNDPWTAAQTVQPAQLVIELQQEKDADTFQALCIMGRVPQNKASAI